jgi:peptidyl-dipeptidase A
MTRTLFTVLVGTTMAVMADSCNAAAGADDNAAAARRFVREHETHVKPLEIAVNQAWWTANISGRDEDFAAKEAAENRLNLTLAEPQRFAQLKQVKAVAIDDPALARQIQALYLQYLEKQVDPALLKRMTAKANAIEKAFNVFRAKAGGKTMTDSEVRQVLAKSRDSAERRRVWEASKEVGSIVAAELRDLVLLRNEAARKLNFANYHAMQLALNEQSQADVLRLFDELDKLTRQPFIALKTECDRRLAADCGIEAQALRPWHYHDPFFQEPPAVFEANLDAPFAKADILRMCREFYAGIGLPIDDVLARSDLYEKPGKSPHAFCTDIDRAGTVRVLANIKPNEYWMSTMLHELGHAVYSSKNIPAHLPYVLRTEAHILTTEGVAMMFERFATCAEWLAAYGATVEKPAEFDRAGALQRRSKLLVFSRWCQVMFRFEKEMYRNPDADLNRLWWDLVEKYQLVRRPEGRHAPDYASKIHIVSAPAYYHNYMLGQLFACQLHAAIARDVLHAKTPATAIYTRNPAVGQYMNAKVFAWGRTKPWNEFVRLATGEELSAKAFAAEFASQPGTKP